jgi:hypothetical protein
MNVEQLGDIRVGSELQNIKPYIDHEVANMQRAVVNSVLSAVNSGELTPEMAMAKWMEYIAYMKLNQRFAQKIEVGKSVGQRVGNSLDFSTKPL